MRTQIEGRELPLAAAWERVRFHYLTQSGRHAEADHARKWCNFYCQRIEDSTDVVMERIE